MLYALVVKQDSLTICGLHRMYVQSDLGFAMSDGEIFLFKK